jgi:hypothetical protein
MKPKCEGGQADKSEEIRFAELMVKAGFGLHAKDGVNSLESALSRGLSFRTNNFITTTTSLKQATIRSELGDAVREYYIHRRASKDCSECHLQNRSRESLSGENERALG